MRIPGSAGLLAVGLVVSALATGCESPRAFPQPRWVAVRIDGFAAVVGRWEGMLVRAPEAVSNDWVRMRIGEDGAYEFASYRTVGAFRGKGTFTLRDGKLILANEEGTATFTLHADGTQRMLRVTAKFKDGIEYNADLQRRP